nr:SH3 domain-containing protein [Propionibacterium sp.]
MNKIALRLRTSIVGLTLAATAAGVGGLVVVSHAIAATQTMVATTDVNLRSGPGMSYDVIGVVRQGERVLAVGVEGSWVKVTADGRTGYVFGDYVTRTESSEGGTQSGSAGTATTNARVYVRTGPGLDYRIITTLDPGVSVRTTGTISGDWTQVLYEDETRWMFSAYLTPDRTGGSAVTSGTATGQVRTTDGVYMRTEGYYGAPIVGILPGDSIVDVTGNTTATYTEVLYRGERVWISSKYIVPATSGPVTLAATTSSLSAKQRTLVNFALAQVGKDYVWAAEGPDAYDCSGLTLAAYKTIGISLPHYSGSQATLGTPVSRSQLQPGDLIFWFSPISHVSLYIGDGMMVHARNVNVGVVKQSVQSYIDGGAYYAGARRILTP